MHNRHLSISVIRPVPVDHGMSGLIDPLLEPRVQVNAAGFAHVLAQVIGFHIRELVVLQVSVEAMIEHVVPKLSA